MYFNIIFIYFIIILLSIGVITAKNPVLAVVLLIVIYIFTSIIFIILGAEFIGLLLIIVYVGAISVLFLFVVMMLNTRLLEIYDSFFSYFSVMAFVLFVFSMGIFIIFYYEFELISYYGLQEDIWISLINWDLDIKIIANVLIGHYDIYLLLAASMLLLGLVGSVALTYKDNSFIWTYSSTEIYNINKVLNRSYGIF